MYSSSPKPSLAAYCVRQHIYAHTKRQHRHSRRNLIENKNSSTIARSQQTASTTIVVVGGVFAMHTSLALECVRTITQIHKTHGKHPFQNAVFHTHFALLCYDHNIPGFLEFAGKSQTTIHQHTRWLKPALQAY